MTCLNEVLLLATRCVVSYLVGDLLAYGDAFPELDCCGDVWCEDSVWPPS